MDNVKKAFIWDLDGTLLDAYPVIIDCLYRTLSDYGVTIEKSSVYEYVKRNSVDAFIRKVEKEIGIDFQVFKDRYSEKNNLRINEIQLVPHAKDILQNLSGHDVLHFVFTHKGNTAEQILQNCGILDSFQEVITSQNGFPRKPNPDAVLYLIEKYHLNPERTYYVGDRTVDMECAKNAGIKSVLFFPENSCVEKLGTEDCIVSDLMEIAEMAE